MRLSLLAAAVCVSSLAAHADTFNFATSGAGGSFSGSGILNASNQGSYYLISSIQGGNPASGLTVTGLIAPKGFDGNNDKLFTNSNLLVDSNGFAFTASQVNPSNQGNTSYMVRLYSSNGAYFIDLTDSNGFSNGAIPASLNINAASSDTVTPEPSSFALLGIGMFGIVGVIRKRFA